MTALELHEIAIRLIIAATLGGLIGLEREFSERPAGLKTHVFVSMGAALIMLVSSDAFITDFPDELIDPARMAAQVVSGIGFLGAGTIMESRGAVSGLTTAATLWIASSIGLAVGIGYYEGALITTGIVMLMLLVVKRLTIHKPTHTTQRLKLVFSDVLQDEKTITSVLKEKDISVLLHSLTNEYKDGQQTSTFNYTVKFHSDFNLNDYLNRISKLDHLVELKHEKTEH